MDAPESSEVEEKSFTIRVIIFRTQSVLLEVKPSDTILEVKEKIYEKTRILVDRQRLFYDDEELEDDNTVNSYAIKTASIIYVEVAYRREERIRPIHRLAPHMDVEVDEEQFERLRDITDTYWELLQNGMWNEHIMNLLTVFRNEVPRVGKYRHIRNELRTLQVAGRLWNLNHSTVPVEKVESLNLLRQQLFSLSVARVSWAVSITYRNLILANTDRIAYTDFQNVIRFYNHFKQWTEHVVFLVMFMRVDIMHMDANDPMVRPPELLSLPSEAEIADWYAYDVPFSMLKIVHMLLNVYMVYGWTGYLDISKPDEMISAYILEVVNKYVSHSKRYNYMRSFISYIKEQAVYGNRTIKKMVKQVKKVVKKEVEEKKRKKKEEEEEEEAEKKEKEEGSKKPRKRRLGRYHNY
jgi:hypothetical protein